MAAGSGLTAVIEVANLPLIEGVLPLGVVANYNRANTSNRAFLEGRLRIESSADPARSEFVFDAQTSGGLLIAVEPSHVDHLVTDAWCMAGAVRSVPWSRRRCGAVGSDVIVLI